MILKKFNPRFRTLSTVLILLHSRIIRLPNLGDVTVPILVLKGKINKPYDLWADEFDANDELRSLKYGIKSRYRGHKMNDPTEVRIEMYAPSLEEFEHHLQTNSDLRALKSDSNDTDSNHLIYCIADAAK